MPRNHLLASVVLLLLGACSRDGAVPSPAPEAQMAGEPGVSGSASTAEQLPAIDTQSPDSVVRSYWALQDWAERNAARDVRLELGESFRQYTDARRALGGGEYAAKTEEELRDMADAFESEPSRRIQQRDIIEVKNESETRAVVLVKIKNVTPLPPGYKLHDLFAPRREFGKEVRYIVERTSGGWRLTQAWYRDDPEDAEWKKTWSLKTPSSNAPSDFDFYYTEH